MSDESIIRSIEHCLSYSLQDSSIVLRNKCDKPINIKAIEIEYYIYIHRAASAQSSEKVELGRLRRRVVERISIEQSIAPSSAINIYFGVLKNIENVFAIIKHGDREYKIRVNQEKQS